MTKPMTLNPGAELYLLKNFIISRLDDLGLPANEHTVYEVLEDLIRKKYVKFDVSTQEAAQMILDQLSRA